MTTEEGVTVHVCDTCAAVWDAAAAPPAACPHCGTSGQWRAAEVRNHTGMVGGRVFVPGTDTPMTRMFICSACKKLHVVRRGDEPPPSCRTCGSTLHEAGAVVPPKLSAQLDEPVVTGKARRLQEKAARVAPSPRPQPIPMDVSLPFSPTAPNVPPEEYRAEWIAERVARWSERCDLRQPDGDVWQYFTHLYDAGRELGFLP